MKCQPQKQTGDRDRSLSPVSSVEETVDYDCVSAASFSR